MDIIAKFDKNNRPIVYDDEKPIAVKVIASNPERFSKFRAISGSVMQSDMKKYVAVLYEIKEEDY